MLKLATTLLGLTLALGSAQAQNSNDRMIFSSDSECRSIGVIETVIQDQYGEQPFSKSEIILQASKNTRLHEGNLVIYINPNTRTYTLVVQFEDSISCVLGIGIGFVPAFEKSTMK